MKQIYACRPPRGLIIHLFVEGYRPGAKSRSVSESAMCGVSVGPHSAPPYPSKAPLSEALQWTLTPAAPSDPRPAWKWCNGCIGHAVAYVGIAHGTLGRVANELLEAQVVVASEPP